MALFLNTNLLSLKVQRQLLVSSLGLDSAFSRLSSGLRIQSAADDAAGLQISNRMTAQLNGLNQAGRNANDAISFARVAEGALAESTNLLQRMRELVIQAGNGINASEDRAAIQLEVSQLMSELNRIAETTEFSGRPLLDGSAVNGVPFLIGPRGQASEFISIPIQNMYTNALGAGATVNGAEVSLNSLSVLDVTLAQAAVEQLAVLDHALQSVSQQRAGLGAIQNRLQYTTNNQANVIENLSAARSRIMDADFAIESAILVRFQIMQQAGVAMLAQANARPQIILSMLR